MPVLASHVAGLLLSCLAKRVAESSLRRLFFVGRGGAGVLVGDCLKTMDLTMPNMPNMPMAFDQKQSVKLRALPVSCGGDEAHAWGCSRRLPSHESSECNYRTPGTCPFSVLRFWGKKFNHTHAKGRPLNLRDF